MRNKSHLNRCAERYVDYRNVSQFVFIINCWYDMYDKSYMKIKHGMMTAMTHDTLLSDITASAGDNVSKYQQWCYERILRAKTSKIITR